jgi:excisionase family DNA binding protein
MERNTKSTSREQKTASINEESLWDVNDIAAFLKVSRSWVYQRAAAGLLPCIKVGGLLRFSPRAIREWTSGVPA